MQKDRRGIEDATDLQGKVFEFIAGKHIKDRFRKGHR